MNRWQEYAIVIGLGLLVSLGVTLFIYWRSERTATPTPTPSAAPLTASPSPITELPDQPTQSLHLTFPDNETVFDTKAITVTGETLPHLPVVIFINQKNFVVESDDAGQFSLDINLDSGSNVIKATTVDEQGINYSDERLVVYTNKSLEEILLTEEEVRQAQDETDNSQGEN